jgi:hypothetical protein
MRKFKECPHAIGERLPALAIVASGGEFRRKALEVTRRIQTHQQSDRAKAREPITRTSSRPPRSENQALHQLRRLVDSRRISPKAGFVGSVLR